MLAEAKTKKSRVEMRNIVKCFPGVVANSNVCFDIDPGEIHALLGENGAGKSTLMRQLYGMYSPDEGDILIDGEPQYFRSPADAIRQGIGMIHQHFMLIPSLTVAQNIALGEKSTKGFLVDTKRTTGKIIQLSKDYGLKVDPATYVWQLSVGEQQRVEILKALYKNAGLIILDEPTAVLTPQEVKDLFVTLKKMAQEGHSLILISHKLNEVMEISDRITVLRDGKVAGSCDTIDIDREGLVRMMIGRDIPTVHARERSPGKESLLIENLHVMGDRNVETVRGVSLAIEAGEILGLAGVSGNGQRELCECLAGLRTQTSGTVTVDGKDISHADLNARIHAGLAYIPEERMRDGAIGEFTVEENVFLHDHKSREFRTSIFLDFRKMKVHAQALVEDYSVKTPGLDTALKTLSGGNIQKLIMARELSRSPRVLVCAQPTRGVDIGASLNIHERLLDQRERGTAILLISEDLDELMALSDRIAVIYEGRIMGVFKRNEMDVERIGYMMAGVAV